MQAAPLPESEYARLMALARYSILDSAPEESFDRLTALVAEVLKVPIVLINFVDQFRQWGKSCVGMETSTELREVSFCSWTILSNEVMIVEDAANDPRFEGNPLVVGEPHISFYAGVPLVTPDGHALGSLCVIDTQAHPFGERELLMLKIFGAVVMEALELRVNQLELSRQVAASAAQVDELRRTAAHAQTLAAIADLFDTDLEPAKAAQMSAELLSQAVEVDWAGLVLHSGAELELVTGWQYSSEAAKLKLAVDQSLSAYRQGVSGTAAQKQKAAFIDDYPAHPNALPDFIERGVQAMAVLPLGSYQDGQYVLVTLRLQPRPWRSSDRALCEAAARSIQALLERQAHLKQVEEAAGQDSLTSLGNRRAFNQAMAVLDELTEPYGVLVADLDGLKLVNDHEGHARGDALLMKFASEMQAQFMPQGKVYRFGGDEFAVLWPNLTPLAEEEALGRVQRAVQRLRTAGFTKAGASAGVAYHPRGAEPQDAAALLELADSRMYEAKRRKRAVRAS
ncbi:sensor domain-containing diguanylate cyclase [Deinococcus psychrotolerans]|uniref:Sensor domain-containing diguanylate cyclase n=1 Tax=Deinococcus psychrotolerans TaxID=2489213 RepID=A0A3G8YFW4_9DEIO|nr:sensor domain-containing diguanylate cyclase [Deinococcus psychrotolerans]AZI41434.1 sensor domain-containing diguanylate cyclase [Deinococcus psychrotolerans]